MNIAIIFAGGTGQRMNTATKPKQFLELHGKPILIHTIEHFESHEMIDGIIIVCVSEWLSFCEKLLDKFLIKKVKAILPGGETGMVSIRNGVNYAKDLYSDDSVVLIHDGVRPLINEKVISDCIKCVEENGNAVTVSPATETLAIINNDKCVEDILDRNCCYLAKAPQCFRLKDINKVHILAQRECNQDFIDSASLMRHYGYKIHIVMGPSENIKITTPADFYIFKALIDAKENYQIMGL